MGFFERLKEGLSKTRRNFTERIQELVSFSASIDEDFLEELEMILLSADVGVKTTEKLIKAVRDAAKKHEIKGTEEVIPFLKKYLSEMLADSGQRTRIGAKPTVILVVGVNGVGKTTTIGKLANYFTMFKYKVVLAAGDTFRAAASEQLTIWAERAGCDIIRHAEGADPAAVTNNRHLLSTYFGIIIPPLSICFLRTKGFPLRRDRQHAIFQQAGIPNNTFDHKSTANDNIRIAMANFLINKFMLLRNGFEKFTPYRSTSPAFFL